MFNKPGPMEVILVGSSFREQILGTDCYSCEDTQTEEKPKRQKKPRRLGVSLGQRRQSWFDAEKVKNDL